MHDRIRILRETNLMSKNRYIFPFTRVVGQEDMKKALLINAVDPSVGGVLIAGSKGTAKSTTVRSMSQFLPSRPAVKGCRFRCDPRDERKMCSDCREKLAADGRLETVEVPTEVIELPLNATEDRVSGTLDIEHILETGKRKFEPGILAAANGNILYVDEINLLDDHIVDLLLDSAAMGTNYVEREGISFSHPANFILVGTMNPEEGELRPQLLDRFGLSVEVKEEYILERRMEVIKRRMQFDADPVGYLDGCKTELDDLRERISKARDLIPLIPIDDKSISMAARLSAHFKMEGHRADLALMRAARANAALDGRSEISRKDFVEIAPMVLSHRIKRKAFEKTNFNDAEVRDCLDKM